MSREYTACSAARDTRRAIAGVRKAMQKLQECSGHWQDLDGALASECGNVSDLPKDVAYVEETLDEIYPLRKHRVGK